MNLDNFAGTDWYNYSGGLKKDCFLGCTSLTTLYVPCVPKNGSIVHHINTSHKANQSPDCNTLGLADCKKVTVVVNPAYLEAYTTRHDGADSYDWRNLWVYNGFNIVGEYPVYGVNYPTDRCFISDKSLNVSKAVSFLGDNITQESVDFSGKIFIGVKSSVTTNRPEEVDAFDASRQVKVYDNGKLLGNDKIAEDGSLSVTFYNPNKHADKSGDHHIDVVYFYDVTFNCASGNLKIAPEVRNNESLGDTATEFEYLNYYNAAAPVLRERERRLSGPLQCRGQQRRHDSGAACGESRRERSVGRRRWVLHSRSHRRQCGCECLRCVLSTEQPSARPKWLSSTPKKQ